jgi:hypothetical protein
VIALNEIEHARESSALNQGDRSALVSKWLDVPPMQYGAAWEEWCESRRRFGRSWQRAIELHEMAYVHSLLAIESFRGGPIGDVDLQAVINLIEEARAYQSIFSAMPSAPPTPEQLIGWRDKHEDSLAANALVEDTAFYEERFELVCSIASQKLWWSAAKQVAVSFAINIWNDATYADRLSFCEVKAKVACLARTLRMPHSPSREFVHLIMDELQFGGPQWGARRSVDRHTIASSR